MLCTLSACGGGGGEVDTGAGVDTQAPTGGTVMDGLGGDIDEQTSTTTVSANWTGFSDDSGSIAGYRWAIGTTPGGTEILDWTVVGNVDEATVGTLAMGTGTTFFVAVRAYDQAGNGSDPVVSDGVTVASGGSGSGSGSQATYASSITQWGITWRFSEAEQVGQFCNGDWWVIGPVSVVEISPHYQVVSGRSINGSMVNPTPNDYNGYDSDLFAPYNAGRYQAGLNVAIGIASGTPLQLAAGSSLISSQSQMTPAANGSFSQMATAAVLTVLDSAPAADAFRPPYSGSDKTIVHRESDLDYDQLADLAAFGSVPDLATTAARFERVWLDHTPGWASRFMHPVENMPDYGRDFTSLYGTGALLANVAATDAQKRDLVVRLVQIGLDHWGNVQNGCYWEGVGGHGSGRKFPILFAGKLLGDSAMLAIGTTHPSGYYGPGHAQNRSQFGEDCQTFYVQQTSSGVYNWGYGGYTSTHNGIAEWGNNHTTWPTNDNSGWLADSYRRCCTGNAWVGQTLTARVMGLRSAWAHDAYFDYMDRFLQTETAGQWTRSWEPWQEQMWDHYRTSF